MKRREPDLAEMRRELALHSVQVSCTRPGWKAVRESETITGPKMRHVIVEAYNKFVRKS